MTEDNVRKLIAKYGVQARKICKEVPENSVRMDGAAVDVPGIFPPSAAQVLCCDDYILHDLCHVVFFLLHFRS